MSLLHMFNYQTYLGIIQKGEMKSEKERILMKDIKGFLYKQCLD